MPDHTTYTLFFEESQRTRLLAFLLSQLGTCCGSSTEQPEKEGDLEDWCLTRGLKSVLPVFLTLLLLSDNGNPKGVMWV